MQITACRLCPRRCGADRTRERGFCGGGAGARVARAALHPWEEPCLSGTEGSGAVFFSGCPLRCRFCQNYEISEGNFGRDISVSRLADIFLELQRQGAHNINLVSPTPYVPWILEALDAAKPDLSVPVVYNTGGYESADTLRALDGRANVYLPDLKYKDDALAARYSDAPGYFGFASRAVLEMYRQTGPAVFDGRGLMRRGLLIRHLALPGAYRDSIAILEWIAANLPPEAIRVSLMSQYTPMRRSAGHPELDRRLTTFEYEKVTDAAAKLGLIGYVQRRESADAAFTPPFDLTGVDSTAAF